MIKQYINGAWKEGTLGTMPLLNPATEEIIDEISIAGKTETLLAIEAAQQSFSNWKNTNAWVRAEYLKKTAQLIRERVDALGSITTLESGKLQIEGKGEWLAAAQLFEWFAEEGKRSYGQTIPAVRNNKRISVIYQPMGVVGIITAWNFPIWNLARVWAAALAAGNSIVCKPSEETPLSAVALVEILEEVGIPAGVVNMVCGDAASIGETLLESPICKKIHFVGSTRVGKLLMDKASLTIKRLSLELGGNAPVIISRHVDIKAVATSAAVAKLRNSGQVCVSPQRFIVHESVYQTFIETLKTTFESMKIGNAANADTQVAPLISARQRASVMSLIEKAIEAGGKCITGGKIPTDLAKGYFLEPTVIADVTPDNPIFKNEVFGPVAVVCSYSNKEEAIALANATDYGLAAYIWTNDLYESIYFSEQVEAGIVGINEWAAHGTEAPFGGWKQSGIGHECGQEGLLEYLELKVISTGGI